MNDVAAATIKDAAQVVEGAGDVQVGNVHMPVLVRLERLDEALALGRGLAVVPLQQAGGAEDAVDTGGGTRPHAGIKDPGGQTGGSPPRGSGRGSRGWPVSRRPPASGREGSKRCARWPCRSGSSRNATWKWLCPATAGRRAR